MTRPSEDELIARYFAPLAGEGGLALIDDAALLRPRAGWDLVLTVDAVVEGVHFLADDPADSVAAKALGVNLSDIAAKGATPLGFLLSLSLPSAWTEAWLSAFAAGLGEAARLGACPLLGGDTVRTDGPLALSITALGEVPEGGMVRRNTARPGDFICVSGTIGDAVLGLALRTGDAPWSAALEAEERAFLIDRYQRPQPRLALAPLLRRHASAAMDISDGLAGDLAKMMRAGGTTARVDVAAIPFSRAADMAVSAVPDLRDRLLTGGDDYEVLCTVTDAEMPNLVAAAEEIGIALTPIGRVESGTALPIFAAADGERSFALGSFSHF